MCSEKKHNKTSEQQMTMKYPSLGDHACNSSELHALKVRYQSEIIKYS